MDIDKRFKFSQWGQDDILEKLFYEENNQQHKGIFIEVGAWNGVVISNTFFLEKCKGWKGLLVEPISSKAEEAQKNRWCDVWKGCVYNRDGEVNFLKINGYSEMLSGINEAYHPVYKARIDREVLEHKQQTELVSTPCLTLNTLMNNFKMTRADLLSLDCQTSELQVLEAYNVKSNPIKAILLDTNGLNVQKYNDWFEKNGYKLYWKAQYADEYLFVNFSLKWSWEIGL